MQGLCRHVGSHLIYPDWYCACWQDAARLAQKVVSNYGMSDLGITVHAPPAGGMGFMRKSFEVRLG